MSTPLGGYAKKKDYLVCIDSDGCAVDSMDIKHIRCFGPCMVDEWDLQTYREELLDRWNEINLYSLTRGINRFKGLAVILKEVDEKISPVRDLASLLSWVEESDELSNAAVSRAAEETGSQCLKKALRWSEAVNKKIRALSPDEVRPFPGAKEAIEKLHMTCDIAVVSSANHEAVMEEWSRFGLLEHTDVVLAQNAGTKTYCIRALLEFGYDTDKVLMIGDALGDMEAADRNGVLYYPILAGHEKESWQGVTEALKHIVDGTYEGEFQRELKMRFIENLS